MSSASLPAASVSKDDLPERRRYTRTVVVGVDGSQIAEYSFDYYIRNLHQHGNYVVLVHAFELPAFHSFQEMYVSHDMWHAAIKREANRATEMQERLDHKRRFHKIPGKFVAKGGKPGEVIVKVAEDEDADLIVVGTRGHGKLRRAIMGSVSSYVSHHAPCPVTICRPKGYHQQQQKEGGSRRRRCQSENDVLHDMGRNKDEVSLTEETKKISIVEDTHPHVEGILHTDKKPVSRQSSTTSQTSSHDSHVHFADEVEEVDEENKPHSRCSSVSSEHSSRNNSHVHFALDSDNTDSEVSPTDEKVAQAKSDSHVRFALDSDNTDSEVSPTDGKVAQPKSDSHVRFAEEEVVIKGDADKEPVEESSGKSHQQHVQFRCDSVDDIFDGE